MKVRDLLCDESKWCKGAYRCYDRMCLMGALREAYKNSDKFGRLLLLRKVILRQFPQRLDASNPVIIVFNDHPETTFADVRKVLELADV